MATPPRGAPKGKSAMPPHTRELLQRLRSTTDPVKAYKISKAIKESTSPSNTVGDQRTSHRRHPYTSP